MNLAVTSPALPPGPLALKVVKTTYLPGPNMWTWTAVLESWIDLGILEQWPSDKLPGFVDRLLAVLPEVAAHHCSPGVPYGFEKRLRDGTCAAWRSPPGCALEESCSSTRPGGNTSA